MPSIGDFDFDLLAGDAPRPLSERIAEYQRAHVDGSDFDKTGQRADPFQLTSTLGVTSAASAKTTGLAYAAAIGDVVTLVDGVGNTWTNVLVRDAYVLDLHAVGLNVGFAASGVVGVLTARWTLQLTE